MIKRTMYCDRCGKLCEDCRSNRGFNLFRIKFGIKTNKSEYLDLCQDCYDSLAEWMKKGIEPQKSEVEDGNN